MATGYNNVTSVSCEEIANWWRRALTSAALAVSMLFGVACQTAAPPRRLSANLQNVSYDEWLSALFAPGDQNNLYSDATDDASGWVQVNYNGNDGRSYFLTHHRLMAGGFNSQLYWVATFSPEKDEIAVIVELKNIDKSKYYYDDHIARYTVGVYDDNKMLNMLELKGDTFRMVNTIYSSTWNEFYSTISNGSVWMATKPWPDKVYIAISINVDDVDDVNRGTFEVLERRKSQVTHDGEEHILGVINLKER